jgi:hypothetical protein
MANELVVKNGLIINGDSNLNGLIKNTGFVNVSSASANTENVSVMKVSGTGGVESWQLDDGVGGQRLTLYCNNFPGGRTTISPVSSSGWSSFEITAVGDCIELIYDSSAGWIITGNRNGSIS